MQCNGYVSLSLDVFGQMTGGQEDTLDISANIAIIICSFLSIYGLYSQVYLVIQSPLPLDKF